MASRPPGRRRPAVQAHDDDDDEPHRHPKTGTTQTPGIQRPRKGKPPATWTPRQRPQHTTTSPYRAPGRNGRRAPAQPMPAPVRVAVISSPAPRKPGQSIAAQGDTDDDKNGPAPQRKGPSQPHPTPVPPRPGDACRPAAGHTVGGQVSVRQPEPPHHSCCRVVDRQKTTKSSFPGLGQMGGCRPRRARRL